MEISVDKWHKVREEGYPDDGDICFITIGSEDEMDSWFIGGYNDDENAFYVDFGLGGMVTKADHVTAWAHIEDSKFTAK